MLKLEKTSQHSGITVRLRERDRFFDSLLLKALAFALIFHVGGFLLFQITPFSFNSSFTFPPVQVQSDQQVQSISVIASGDPDENDALPPPPLAMVPPLETASLFPPSTLTPSLSLNPHVFQPVEEHIWPLWQTALSLDLNEPRIQLKISGELAEHRLLATDPLMNETIPITVKSSPVYVRYHVRMNEQNGELFWIEKIEASGKAPIDRLTRQIALNLRFEPADSLDALEGMLNFVVLIPDESWEEKDVP